MIFPNQNSYDVNNNSFENQAFQVVLILFQDTFDTFFTTTFPFIGVN